MTSEELSVKRNITQMILECLKNMESIVEERWAIIDVLYYEDVSEDDKVFLLNYINRLLDLYNNYSNTLTCLSDMLKED